MLLFENNFHDGIDFSNMKTSALSEENISKCIKKIMEFDDEDRRRIDKANCEKQVSAIEFSQWLCKQDDIPEKINVLSDYLTLGVPVPPELAKLFDHYIARYNAFLELKKRRRKK